MVKIDETVFHRLRALLHELTGNDMEEIVPESDLEEDLGLNLDVDLSRLVEAVNREFEIHLSEKTVYQELTEEAHPSVAELAKLIYDEYELG